MSKQYHARNGVNWLLAMAAMLFTAEVKAQPDMIDPTGAIYSGISASSQFPGGSYGPEHLFDTDLTGVAIGAQLSGGDWADDGASITLGPAYVAFQLDNSYQVGAIYYAQRAGNSGNPVDKITSMSVWVSSTTPFDPLNPPTNAPDAVIPVPDKDGAILHRYVLSAAINGQYFLVEVSQSPTAANSNIGGNELRLGYVPTQTAPVVLQQPVDITIYAGGTAHFSVRDSGPVASSYQWRDGNSALTNGGRFSGVDTANLVISGIGGGDAGSYSCVLTNIYGSTNSDAATLAVLPAPTTAEALAVVSHGAVAYWQLNEAVGATTAADLAGGYTGTYGATTQLGVAGPQAPTFPGFTSSNTAAGIIEFDTASAVALPPLNLNGTNVTLMAWINPDGSIGAQNPYTGIVYCRGAGTSAGLIFSSDGTKLAYQWNGDHYFFDSGIVIPSNQWSLVAMVVTSTNVTLYCGLSNVVVSAVDMVNNVPQTFGGTTYIGLDTDVGESARTYNGAIDDVGFFDRALSGAEIDALFAAGTGAFVPLPVQITTQPTNQTLLVGDPLNLKVQVNGTSPYYFQWYKGNAPITGASNSTYAVANVTTNDSGTYYVVVSNQVNAVTSSNATVSVLDFHSSIISPNGSLYTSVSASSEYPSGGYGASNLFDTDLTGVVLGAQLSGGDWADDGTALALGPAYVAFQLDTNYPVGAVYYAQRSGAFGGATDKITALSLWASQSAAFDPFNPPATDPDAMVAIPDIDAAILHRYILAAPVTGQYFLAKVEQNPTVAGSNIGGNELRLGTLAANLQAFTFSLSASGLVLHWSGGILYEADDLNGPWTVVSGVASGTSIPMTAPKKFYRVKY